MKMETKRKQDQQYSYQIKDFEINITKETKKNTTYDQRINPRRRYNNYKYICTQHGSTAIVRQMLTSMKGEINNNTIIVGDFNTPLTPMDRSTKQKINKATQTINDTIDQLDLIDIYRTLHPKTMNFTFSLKRTWNLLQDRSHPGP